MNCRLASFHSPLCFTHTSIQREPSLWPSAFAPSSRHVRIAASPNMRYFSSLTLGFGVLLGLPLIAFILDARVSIAPLALVMSASSRSQHGAERLRLHHRMPP